MTTTSSAASAVESPSHGVLFDVGYTLLDETDRLGHALEWAASWMNREWHARGHEGRVTVEMLHQRYVEACEQPDAEEPSLFVQMLTGSGGRGEAGGTGGTGVSREEARQLRRDLAWDAVPLTACLDATAALQSLREAGLRVGVLANQPASARDDLDRTGLAPLLDGVWLSESCGLAKPDPAFFQLALDAWRLPPHRVAYVGDRPDNDVAPAHTLGLHTALLHRGPHARQTAAVRPDFQADSLASIADHLRQWAGGEGPRPGSC